MKYKTNKDRLTLFFALIYAAEEETFLNATEEETVIDSAEEERFIEIETHLLTSATAPEISPVLEDVNGSVRLQRPVFINKRFDTKIRGICFKIDKFFDIRDDNRKTELIRMACASVAQDLRRALFRKRMADGRFTPNEGESEEAQVARCWREHNRQRIATSTLADATLCTCTRCGNHIHKTIQRNGNIETFVLANGCSCEAHLPLKDRIKKLTLGLHVVVGSYLGMFPRENIFRLVSDR